MRQSRYRIDLDRRAEREFMSLPKEVIRQISDVLEDLQNDPRPPGSKKLTVHEGYRIRIGVYRILYTTDDKRHILRIYRVGHRREIYR